MNKNIISIIILIIFVVGGYFLFMRTPQSVNQAPGTPSVNNIQPSPTPVDCNGQPREFAGCLTVLSPNGGEKWEIGKTYTITWKADAVPYYVELYLTDKSRNISIPIVTKTAKLDSKVGSYTWTVPKNVSVGSNYTIQASADYPGPGAGSYFSDVSDAPFSIVK